MVISSGLAALGLAALLEWPHYAAALGLERVQWTTRAAVAAVLVAKTWWLLLAPVAFAALLAATGLVRAGRLTAAAGKTAVLLWLVTDLRVQAFTGNHLLEYAGLAGEANAGDFGGGLQASMRDLAMLGLAFGAASWALLAATRDLLSRAASPTVATALAAAWTLLGAAALPLAGRALDPGTAGNLALALPFATGIAGGRPAGEAALEEFEAAVSSLVAPTLAARHGAFSDVRPTDRTTRIARVDPPDVVLLVVESLRAASVREDVAPRLLRWASRGTTWKRHYAGSNKSHYGMFTLLYARPPLFYRRTVRSQPPQFAVTMSLSGYRTTYASSLDHRGWIEMDSFLNERTFDRLVLHVDGRDCLDWPDRDLRTLGTVRRALESPERPRFVVAFLGSTHYPYMAPATHVRRFPVAEPELTPFVRGEDREPPRIGSIFRADAAAGRQGFLNRYHNALGFLDDAIGDFLDSVDASRTIVVVTGDHGESFWDDGTLAHSWKPSEAQNRTFFAMVGPGVPARDVEAPTTHADVLPTLLPILQQAPLATAHASGEDVLATSFSRRHATLAGFEPPSRDLDVVLVADEGRMHLRYRGKTPGLEVVASLDAAGKARRAPPEGGDAATWAARIASDVARLSR